ncbi:TPA: hypothetical protein P0E21_001873 [Vibrio harveyi]|nr:hypothetical protein [Vibrio harveyi]
MKKLVILLVVSVFSSVVFSATLADENTDKKSVPPVENKTLDVNSDGELYQKLYDVSVKSNESLVQSTQNSLNIVVGFILFLFGSQTFYKYQVAKKEIESLKATLNETLVSESSRVDVELANFREALLSEVNAKIESNYKETEKEFSQKINDKAEKADQALNNGYKDLRDAIKIHVDSINFQLDTVKSELWSVKGVTSNVLRSLVSQLKYHLVHNNQPPQYLLQDILDNLTQATRIEKETKSNLVDSLSQVSGQNELVSKIIEQSNSLPLYEFIKDSNGNLHSVNLT